MAIKIHLPGTPTFLPRSFGTLLRKWTDHLRYIVISISFQKKFKNFSKIQNGFLAQPLTQKGPTQGESHKEMLVDSNKLATINPLNCSRYYVDNLYGWKHTKSRKNLAAADSLNNLFGLAVIGIELWTDVTRTLLSAFLMIGLESLT